MTARPPPPPYTPTVQPVERLVPLNGITFRTVLWRVPADVAFRARVVFVHGFCEHAELYWQVCDTLAQLGFECFFYDQRGAGLTLVGATRGITNQQYAMEDLDAVLTHVLGHPAPNLKVFLLGHLLGGAMVLNYCVLGKYRAHLTGVISLAPLVVIHATTRPPRVVVGALKQVIKVAPNVRFNPHIKLEQLMHKGEWADYHKLTSLTMVGSLQQLNDMNTLGERLVDPEFLQNFDENVPVLVTHGEADVVNDIEGLRRFCALVPSLNVQLVTYEYLRHTTYLAPAPIREKWLLDVVLFMCEQSCSGAPLWLSLGSTRGAGLPYQHSLVDDAKFASFDLASHTASELH